jgi:predicted RNA binding protein YcfA (HicA-like mRNA interferase family)
MSQREKLLERFKTKPKDFTWDELEKLLNSMGYVQEKGDGSRRKFYNSETCALISLHKPHPGRILKSYQVTDVLNHLQERGVL